MVSEAPWDIYRAVWPLLILSRALGLAPVRRAHGGAGGILPSKGAELWASILCLSLVAGLVYYCTFFSLLVSFIETDMENNMLNETSLRNEYTKILFTEGVQTMLIEIMSVFVNIISSVFSSVSFGILYVIHSLLLDVVTILALSLSGFHCTTQANNTATLISRLLLQPTSPGARRLLARFASQLLHARTRICACGLLVLDSELLAQMAGAIATYTVILVQYKGAKIGTSLPDANATLSANLSDEGLQVNSTLAIFHGFSNNTLSLGSA